ncbi:unnamed protein product, partial [Protopolystoma xenopodis]
MSILPYPFRSPSPSAPLIAQTLEFRASAVNEQKKARAIRITVEQTVNQELQMLPTDVESLRQMLHGREAMVARLAQEREASLQSILQHVSSLQLVDSADLLVPAESELRATWADVDRVAEAALAELRRTTEAYEVFEETFQRLTNVLAGAKHLVEGKATVSSVAALAMAVTDAGDSGALDITRLGLDLLSQ